MCVFENSANEIEKEAGEGKTVLASDVIHRRSYQKSTVTRFGDFLDFGQLFKAYDDN